MRDPFPEQMTRPEYIHDAKQLISHFPEGKKLILVDSNTRICAEKIGLDSESVLMTVPAGEQSKSLETAQEVWNEMLRIGMTRSDYLICIGGGVVTDLGAFCASTFKRGLPFVHVPTSLLAMIDASIGGKNGVNYAGFKNYIGTFNEPEKILICRDFLSSLPVTELQSGYGEMYKHALLGSAGLWELLEIHNSISEPPQLELIRKAAEIKCKVVEKDFTEKGQRKVLNLGHTVGHAIEAVYANERQSIMHGYAVIAGIVIEGTVSEQLGKINSNTWHSISSVLLNRFGKISLETKQIDSIIQFARGDKKSKDAAINCSLLKEIEKVEIDCIVSEEALRHALQLYIDA